MIFLADLKWRDRLQPIPEYLAGRFRIDPEPLRPVADRYPMRITPYYLGLIKEVGDPIWRQCVPDARELEEGHSIHSYNEAELSPVPGLIHRYPDRVVLLVSSACPTFCRFCMRKSWISSRRSIVLITHCIQLVGVVKDSYQV
jgi:lysine 2,3-aminomutase